MIVLIVDLFFIFLVIAFVVPFFTSGLGYAPTKASILKDMIDLAEVKPGEKAVDIGSGDGRIVIALAKAGAEAHGYELNPVLVWISRWRIWRSGLTGKAFIHQKNFWHAQYGEYSLVMMFAVKYLMKSLETKLKKDLLPGARVVTNHFGFPTWPPLKTKKGVSLYKKM
jgi:protein-L-isoaspartate O-methyltransferase